MERHRLPSGFGSVRYLGAGRTKPYAVHLPAVREDAGAWKRPPALCYVSTWEAGLKVLALCHTGFYKAGMEDLIDSGAPLPVPESREILCAYCGRVLEDIERIKNGEVTDIGSGGGQEKSAPGQAAPTFLQVYQSFHDYKYGSHAQRQLSKSTRNATNAAYRRFIPFYARPFDRITVDDLQELVNEVADEGYSKSTVSRMVTLSHQLWKYAYPRGLCRAESGKYVEMPKTKEETHHQDFTDGELAKLWKVYREKADPVVRMILIMCYSGYRVGEYEAENFRVFEEYFQGGFKTEAGRNRIVPIHSAILPLVEEIKLREEPPREYAVSFFCGNSSDQFREDMKAKLAEIGIDGKIADGTVRYHTPHSCRHTFSRLCESYGVNEADRKRMMGHSFRGDITNGVYGHRSVRELQEQIEKIQIPEGAGAAGRAATAA